MIEITVPLGPIAHLRITGDTTQDVRAQLSDVERSEIPSILGRVVADAQRGLDAQESIGRNLGGQVVEERPLEQEEERGSGGPVEASTPAPAEGVAGTGLVFSADPAPEFAQTPPGAPLVHGQPAWLVPDPQPNGQTVLAFVQPTWPIDMSLPTTSDPDDPRILQKTARFYRRMA